MLIIIITGDALNASRKLCPAPTSANARGHYAAHHGDADEHDLKNDVIVEGNVPDYGPDASALGFDPGFDRDCDDDDHGGYGDGECPCPPLGRSHRFCLPAHLTGSYQGHP
jgi:hypothetical protein